MNHIATIPQKIAKQGALVVLPRKQYDLLVRAARLRIRPAQGKMISVGLREALEEVKQGRAVGPFNSVRDLMKSLRASTTRG